jgi:hypothetical protein
VRRPKEVNMSHSTTTEQPTQTEGTVIAVASRSFSVSFPGGETSTNIIARSASCSQEELYELIYSAQAIGALVTVTDVNTKLGAYASLESDEEPTYIEDVTKLSRRGIDVDMIVNYRFTGSIVVSREVQDAMLELENILLDSITKAIDKKAIDETSNELADNPPPGLQQEYWEELVERFPGECLCGHPDCIEGVLMAVSRGYDYLVDNGISHDAAEAAVDNGALKMSAPLYGIGSFDLGGARSGNGRH